MHYRDRLATFWRREGDGEDVLSNGRASLQKKGGVVRFAYPTSEYSSSCTQLPRVSRLWEIQHGVCGRRARVRT